MAGKHIVLGFVLFVVGIKFVKGTGPGIHTTTNG
jgi:hypothetical protein